MEGNFFHYLKQNENIKKFNFKKLKLKDEHVFVIPFKMWSYNFPVLKMGNKSTTYVYYTEEGKKIYIYQ